MANSGEEHYSLEEILAEFHQPAEPKSRPAASGDRPRGAVADPSPVRSKTREEEPASPPPPLRPDFSRAAPAEKTPEEPDVARTIAQIQLEKRAAPKPAARPGTAPKPAQPRQVTMKFPAVKEMARKAEEERSRPRAADQEGKPRQRTLSTQPPPKEPPRQSPPRLRRMDLPGGQEAAPHRERFDPEEPEEPPKPKKRLPYDRVNRPAEDAVQAASQLGRRLGGMAVRLLLLLPVLAAALYLTAAAGHGLPVPAGWTYLDRPTEYLWALAGCQLLILLLCWENTLSGLWRLCLGRPTLDTLVTVSGAVSLAYCVTAALLPHWREGLPYVCVNGVTGFFALVSKRQRYAALRRNYKALTMGASPAGVKCYSDGKIDGLAVKTQSGVDVDPRELSRPDLTERYACWYAPIILALAAALSASVTVAQGEKERMLWAASSILSVTAPMCLLLSSSASAKRLGKKLYTSGSMLVNAACAGRLSRCRLAALRDADLHPAGAVKITGMKIAENQEPETVVGCAASLLQEVGGGLGQAFTEFAKQMYVAPKRARELRFFDTRGIAALVGERYVQLGTASYLMRMGVRVTEGLKLKNTIFVAIDSQFAGIFSIRYEAQNPVYAAFGLLKYSRIRPVLALRDPNQTQQGVEARFELKKDAAYLPDLEERLRYSASSFGKEEETLALLSRDGLLPFAEVLAAAKKSRRAAWQGCLLGTLCALSGMLILAFLARKGAAEAADPMNVLAYLLLWSLTAKLFRGIVTRM